MSKRKRRKGRRRGVASQEPRKGDLRFVVGSSAGAKEGVSNFDLGHELNLIKAALLYADRVELVSVGASMLAGWVALRDVPPTKRMALVREHGGHRLNSGQLEKLDLVMGDGARARGVLNDRERVQAKIQLRAVLDQGWDDLTCEIEELFESYNARGLREATSSGLVEMHSFAYTDVEGLLTMAADKVPVSVAVDEVVGEYVERASIAIEGSGYPLFDDMIGQLVGEAVREGLIVPSPAGVRRGRHGGLAGDLLGRLPLFEEATVDEILDIRRELDGVLRGFRTAVSEFSNQVESAAWDPAFAEEADTLFREKVEQEVERIEQAVRENGSLRERLGAYGPGMAAVGGASMSAFIGSGSALGALAALAAGLPAATWRGTEVLRRQRQEIQGNQLYFYYQASRLLRTT